jgi:hypothetical protein
MRDSYHEFFCPARLATIVSLWGETAAKLDADQNDDPDGQREGPRT